MTETSISAAGVNTAEFDLLAASFVRWLEAANRSPKTITTYRECLASLRRFLIAQGMPTDPTAITREHLQEYISDQLRRWKPATANNRYRGLQQYFKFLEEEGEIDTNPMQRMKPPHVPVESPAVMSEKELKRLIRTCEGSDLTARRDMAIIRLFLDTGMRRAELARLNVDDIDLDNRIAVVMGKNRRPRACPFGRKTALSLDRYIRSRRSHRDSHRPELWLGHAGPMTPNGVYQVIVARAGQAGLGHIKPHQFRHSFAHSWLVNGGSETDLMRLTGWQSRSMLQRYGASAADERARAAYQDRSPGDRI